MKHESLNIKESFFVISYYLVNFDGLADLFPSLFLTFGQRVFN
ncbi:hypothetical protein HMPREF1226_0332 [Streptococcus pyogenes UTMEM-1]|nr:hypothetical protein HMPREF0841_0728 [Streptococcus pyogenes ATCC 10782]EQL77667.1 hypothetical protein HMPREF1225_1869 [Streptococcus pyogenes UTSW-2]EQL80469.1 hypothetical protein HMPREF1226_0332 [Streptococcus pyogenes UTMEM-1]ESA59217.1 hypothetical protein HMPREF1238_0021 [Streptococcus pyogenes GA40377]KGE57546.1 putative membrane protein [Streptococcus pyogenes MGAS2111]